MTQCKKMFPLSIFILISALLGACSDSSSTPKEQYIHAVDGAYTADISNDGKYSIVSSVHHELSYWDLEKNALLYNWGVSQDSADNLVLAVDIADNNSHVVTADKETFALWNATSGESEGYWKVRESTIRDIVVANDGRYVLVGKANGVVVHININNGRRLEFLGHQEKVNTVDMLPNGRIAISGSNDFVAYVWDTQSGQVIYRFNHTSRVTKVALDAKGKYAFTGDSKKGVHIWNLATGERISTLDFFNRQEIFSTVRFSPDGEYLLTGAPNRKVSLWQVATGKRINTWLVSSRKGSRPPSAVVYSVAFRDNNHIITESSSGINEVWPIN